MLSELDRNECWELAASVPVGRIAWTTASGPVVVPVNFVIEEERVVLHTAPYAALVREADDSVVAFEVDEIDPVTRCGWSVLLRGRARAGGAGGPTVDTWAGGGRRLTVVIDVHEITGRRVGAP